MAVQKVATQVIEDAAITDAKLNTTGTMPAWNGVEGTPVIEEKDLALLKEEMLIAVFQRVEELLNKYDWMTHREVEGGTPMPDNIKTYRANLRAENNTKEIEINSITTMDDFIAYDITYKTVI